MLAWWLVNGLLAAGGIESGDGVTNRLRGRRSLRHNAGGCPQRYLTSVLAKIGQTKLSELGQLLPDVWKAEDVGPLRH